MTGIFKVRSTVDNIANTLIITSKAIAATITKVLKAIKNVGVFIINNLTNNYFNSKRSNIPPATSSSKTPITLSKKILPTVQHPKDGMIEEIEDSGEGMPSGWKQKINK